MKADSTHSTRPTKRSPTRLKPLFSISQPRKISATMFSRPSGMRKGRRSKHERLLRGRRYVSCRPRTCTILTYAFYADLRAQLDRRDELLRSRTPPPVLDVAEVSDLLWDCGGTSEADLERQMKLSGDQALTVAVASNRNFQRWFTSVDSEMLFISVDGSVERSASTGFVAAMATLCRAVSQQSTAIAYFCGLANPQTPDVAAALMGSLSLQLLRNHPYDLRAWSSKLALHDHHAKLGTKDIGYLNSFFKHLCLPLAKGGSRNASVIYCLVDDFASLERAADMRSVWRVMSYLYDLVESTDLRPVVLKVLVMRPERGGSVLKAVDERDLVRVHDVSRGADSHTSQRELNFQLERARRMREEM
ncbi:hypothetical protein BAUCODRAFT_187191 [Baudoinia panamericana UAMH 10762]|uniref:Uncharacterized protein n=1 Tax=Baudoinia panamericana (strain UAMH 10762) TaxID=717646 RepID=M2MV80_BAUPA|nr:uncharacterized protein BAUCODRAFT_187191 [Baudoinia panamericana UAMH 10762]EMD00862.1 hypothetical protein BAUCODRAFT_187191 [Baudoinia panamericana UAMH 10762]